ncbi:MAG: hypothetical protein AB7T06_43735 [Kofleriaceae bacterium]
MGEAIERCRRHAQSYRQAFAIGPSSDVVALRELRWTELARERVLDLLSRRFRGGPVRVVRGCPLWNERETVRIAVFLEELREHTRVRSGIGADADTHHDETVEPGLSLGRRNGDADAESTRDRAIKVDDPGARFIEHELAIRIA